MAGSTGIPLDGALEEAPGLTARIIPLDAGVDAGGLSGAQAVVGAVEGALDSGGAVRTSLAAVGEAVGKAVAKEGALPSLVEFDVDEYADQVSYEDAMVLYAKDYKRGGHPPPAWNRWQSHAYQIAKLYPVDTDPRKGDTAWFAGVREKTMAEVYGREFKKLVAESGTGKRRSVSRALRPGLQGGVGGGRRGQAKPAPIPGTPLPSTSKAKAIAVPTRTLFPEPTPPPPLPVLDRAALG